DPGIPGCKRIGKADFAAIVPDLTGVGLEDAAADSDQGRFYGAVLPDQGLNFAAGNGEADVVEGAYAAEFLHDAAELDDRVGLFRRNRRSHRISPQAGGAGAFPAPPVGLAAYLYFGLYWAKLAGVTTSVPVSIVTGRTPYFFAW